MKQDNPEVRDFYPPRPVVDITQTPTNMEKFWIELWEIKDEYEALKKKEISL